VFVSGAGVLLLLEDCREGVVANVRVVVVVGVGIVVVVVVVVRAQEYRVERNVPR